MAAGGLECLEGGSSGGYYFGGGGGNGDRYFDRYEGKDVYYRDRATGYVPL